MRKWPLLIVLAAIVIAPIMWRCLSVPHETLTFQFVDAFNGRPVRVSVAIHEYSIAYFPAAEKLLERLSLFTPAPSSEQVCSDGTLPKVRLAKHPRRQTTIVCSSSFHQTAAVLSWNGTNRLDAIGLGRAFTNDPSYSLILHPTNAIVTVPLYHFSDYPLN